MNIISVDWSIKKPLCYYDGTTVKETFNPRDIKGDLILIETGAPYSLFAYLSQTNSKVLVVKGEETNEFRNGVKTSDADDAIAIFELYKVKPELFVEIEERNVVENKLKYHIKMRSALLHSITKMNNESKALEKEYIISEIHREIIGVLEKRKGQHEGEIERWAQYLYSDQISMILYTKVMARLNASIFVSLVNVNKFSKYSKFEKFCGFAPKNITQYNRDVKNLLWTSCDSTVVKHRLEPYRSKYDTYKEKKLKELKLKHGDDKKGLKGHAHALAMRKACQLMLKELWKRLRTTTRISCDGSLNEMININVPKQNVDSFNYKDNTITIKLKLPKGQKSMMDY